jgi:hypothetical protein
MWYDEVGWSEHSRPLNRSIISGWRVVDMVETINLRLARKRKERAERERAAQLNRARFGRSRSESDRDKAQRVLDEARLSAHRRDDGDD